MSKFINAYGLSPVSYTTSKAILIDSQMVREDATHIGANTQLSSLITHLAWNLYKKIENIFNLSYQFMHKKANEPAFTVHS